MTRDDDGAGRLGVLPHCGQIARRFDHERYLASLFAPGDAREFLWATLAFNHEIARIREIVREPLLGHMRLQWWRDALDALASGSPPPSPVVAALSEVLASGRLDLAALRRLIEARARDLDDAPFATIDDLDAYARATAEPLADAGLSVLDVDDGATATAARAVATAWAMAGLARAIPFHARQRRSFLPADLVAAHGFDLSHLYRASGPRPGLPPIAAAIVDRACSWVRMARRLRGKAARPALRRASPLLLQATLVDRAAARLAEASYDPFAMVERPPGMSAIATLMTCALLGRY